MEILYFLFGAAFAGQRQAELLQASWKSGRTSCLANHVRVMAFRQSLPLFRNGKLKKSLAGYMAFGGTGDRPAHWAFLCVAGMEVFGDCRERSHHVREQLKSKRWKQSQTDLQASTSMCVDSLRGGFALDLDLSQPASRIRRFFGSASWQTRGVATVITLFIYNHF